MRPPPPEHSQLCRLIVDSLRPFKSSLDEPELRLNKQTEKQLLISLSQILRKIQLWTAKKLDSGGSDDGLAVKEPAWTSESSCGSKPLCNDHECITKIVSDVILVLSVESRFVQHLAGNILMAISDYLVASESDRGQFLKSLCVCLELAISNALLLSLDKAQVSNHDAPNIFIALQPRLKRTTWSSVVSAVRVLRAILKRMKQDIDEQLLEVYLDSISASLAKMPWDIMDQNWDSLRVLRDSVEGEPGQLESMTMLQGTLLQLFCSLINLSGSEGAGGSFDEHPIICQISNLIPQILGWSLTANRNNVCMFEYLRHKVLMLMIRLSSLIDLKHPLLVLWLHLLHEYFEDLLLLPLTQLDQDTLEGSPFIASVSNTRKCKVTSCHLQRLAILLFLRCSFSLIVKDSDLNCPSRKKGLSELNWWLQSYISSELSGASEFYFERCISFSISFLRLFLHEDDILFELLLLLFCVPFNTKQHVRPDIHAVQERTDDIILYHVSNLLNPMQLFHVFLAELHYDHQVLLDYLISKDTGSSFAEYLLRSLRIACDSWTEFMELSVVREVTNKRETGMLSGTKRKALADVSDYRDPLISYPEKGDCVIQKEDLVPYNTHFSTNGLSFEKLKDCLLTLKRSLQNLHQKELFPYNPEVLLRRLTRFHEHCLLK